MRLIDADKLMLSLADWKLQEEPIHTYEKPKEFTADDMQRMIWRTIRDCESAVEEQPTVEAIPIEFIKQLIEKFDCERGNAIKDTFAHVLTGLLEFWEFEQEKENEKDSE